ncbi:putative rhamnosyl transferase [Novosphingobium sp. 9]|uniref:putative rhamnosyl transferase n=1 Tax=Novosphingobium sp. 9 TaxID=2025349 RepID=UPI0021B4E4B7|nr:putative rhamnosyl transferase [Novosphingobium sp. 9]
MRHIILTRFNIASPGRESAIRNSPGWLARRFELFERYCLPSVADQTDRQFDWLIYFDENTPQEFRDRIARAQEVMPFSPRFVGVSREGIAARDVSAMVGTEEDIVLTTRLDNDDGIARDFVRRIQAAAHEHAPGTVLNFPHGVAMRDGRLFTATDRSNPFTSLIENGAAPIKTIWSAQHHELATKWNLTQVESPPMWLQVVHGENVTNRIKGRRLPAATILDDFTLRADVKARSVNAAQLMLDRLVLGPMRDIREQVFLMGKPVFKKLLRR